VGFSGLAGAVTANSSLGGLCSYSKKCNKIVHEMSIFSRAAKKKGKCSLLLTLMLLISGVGSIF